GLSGDLRRRSAATAGARVRQFEVRAQGLARKQLMLMPSRVAMALQADGWTLRSEIVWAKRAPMPEAVTDRPTCAHERIWLLSKSPDYFYDAEAVKEETTGDAHSRGAGVNPKATAGREAAGKQNESWSAAVRDVVTKRNMRNVWHLSPEPFPEAHFACFPRPIPERAIMAGTSAYGCCSECGAPWLREVERTSMQTRPGPGREGLKESAIGVSTRNAATGTMTAPPTSRTTGWRPGCEHGAGVVECTVLDPFMGSGTTAEVAQKLGRNWIGIEAQADYLPMQERRTAQGALRL
ncbi:MAG: DNA-methyltransferase, partial [Mycobacterium sp.]